MKWAEFKFPPINLFSHPMQDIDYMRDEVADCKRIALKARLRIKQMQSHHGLCKSITDVAERRLKNLEFIYYTRTGRFPE